MSKEEKYQNPRITFGMIVLNGEPFLRYNLEALYPFAHEIIVVEGSSQAASRIASPDGHSLDNTLLILNDFKQNHDPENKLSVVTAEDEGYANGFWPGEKHEQSQAYAKRATGNYLWQVDVDEFYRAVDMKFIIQMLISDSSVSAISFKQIAFWGSPNYIVDSYYLRMGGDIFHRIFKWGDGYHYLTHRPPTVLNADLIDTRKIKWVRADDLARKGIFLYHYSLLFPKQVQEKCNYYREAEWIKKRGYVEWAEKVYFQLKKPYRAYIVYDSPGWLENYKGDQPAQIKRLLYDANHGLIDVEQRRLDDVKKLTVSLRYRIGSLMLKLFFPIWRMIKITLGFIKKYVKKLDFLSNAI